MFYYNLIMQTVHDGRQFMKYIDPKLGVPLPERDYGGNCLVYDPGNVTDPFHNIWVRSVLFTFKGLLLNLIEPNLTQFSWRVSLLLIAVSSKKLKTHQESSY